MTATAPPERRTHHTESPAERSGFSVGGVSLGYVALAAEIVRDRSMLDPDYPVCARLGCVRPASATTLAGATRVATCFTHTREYVERYPDSADTVWPLGLAT